jgi:hypothetical protein
LDAPGAPEDVRVLRPAATILKRKPRFVHEKPRRFRAPKISLSFQLKRPASIANQPTRASNFFLTPARPPRKNKRERGGNRFFSPREKLRGEVQK